MSASDDSRYAAYPSLRGRVVLVTGGGSGIGASIVEHFCRQESRVAFVDIAADASRALCANLQSMGLVVPTYVECDLRDIVALRTAVSSVGAQLGSIDVLVNNAASDDRHAIGDVTPEYWDERMAVNLRHQFFAAQAVYPQMRAQGRGSIINLGSISWMFAQGGMPAYTTAKAAIHGLTRSLARDYGPDGVRVNTVVPGWVMTQRQIEMWLDEDSERDLLTQQCLKTKLVPADIARMVLFLAADDGAMCTAQNFIVDAGRV